MILHTIEIAGMFAFVWGVYLVTIFAATGLKSHILFRIVDNVTAIWLILGHLVIGIVGTLLIV